MKCRLFLLMLLFVCTGLFAQNVSLDQAVQTSTQAIETRLPKGAKVAVLTFTSTKQAFSDYIIDELATALSASRNIQVIDRQHTDAIRKEFNIQFSGDVSDDEVKRVGRQLGAQYVVTGSLVDIGNAYRFRVAGINIETAVREGSSSLNININDPQVVFLLTGQRPGQPGTAYKIGDRGPGGGFIFYISGNLYNECSPIDIGVFTTRNAWNMVSAYSNNGFNDWRLPNLHQLNSMYINLKQRNIGGFVNGEYLWTYSGSGYGAIDFSNGSDKQALKDTLFNVRAVREFRITQ
jgi:TolB-like protein